MPCRIQTFAGHAGGETLLVAAVAARVARARVDHTSLRALAHVRGVLLESSPEELLCTKTYTSVLVVIMYLYGLVHTRLRHLI